MADQQHLISLLKKGTDAWNTWRIEPFEWLDLSGANLQGACLDKAILRLTDLKGANLKGASLYKADLVGVDLRGADLEGANLRKADLDGACLEGANLVRAYLPGADLDGANLQEADLTEARLPKAFLSGANLHKAILRRAYLVGAYLSGVDLREADLSGADLTSAVLVDTNLEQANLMGCSVYGVSVWNAKLAGAVQLNLIITRPDESTFIVDDLELAQFIYLLLDHKKFRNVLNAVTKRGVLILGRFRDGGLGVLQSVAAKLREMDYLPIIFDFDRPESRNYTETVKTLVGLSRFVIADLSGSSVPHELYAIVPHFKIPLVPILERGKRNYAMIKDILEYPWVLSPIVEFTNKDHLLELIPSMIIGPAEEKHKERQALLEKVFGSQ